MKRKNIFVIVISLFLCASLLVVSAATISEIANNETNGDEQLPVFLDVKETDWFYDDVRYVQENKLMTGTSETEFSPSGATTRGMIVTILWRVEGEPVVEGKDFDDVGSDAWYSKAVAWASNNQIVSGYSETTFGPNDTATREQLATIMYRYASYKKCDLSKKAKLDKYEDREDISYYAVESIEWANANGIISGTSETTISPKDNVLRSQVAAILRRFCENFKIIDNSVVDEKENAEEIADDKKEESKEEKEEDNDFGGGGFIGAGGGPDEPIIPEEEIPEEDKIVETQRPAINIKTAYGDPGEYITVLVDIEDNPGILGMILQIEYDENAMTLVGAENGEAIENVLTLTTSKELNSGAKFVWDGLEITPSQIEDGTVLKLEFRLSDDAIYGSGNNFGDYRLVQAGTMHVFGVVRYDVATGTYSTYTYNVLDDEVEEWLDYSYDGSFNDYESSVIPFEIPYYVNDYVNNRLYRTEGLKINAATGMIVGYTPTGDQPDNIVIIPSYWQIPNNDGTKDYDANNPDAYDGTFSSVKITGITPGLFENNTDLTAVKLGKFITEIPDNTFSGCTNLQYVMAPSITSIGSNAFSGCESLTEFKISEAIESVGENAFANAPSVTAVASSVEVAKAIAESGANNILLDISKIPDDENSDLTIEIGEIESFKLIGQSKEYKGLSLKSDAVSTVVNGITFTENTKIPMELSSENVTLDNVTVACSGYAMALKAPETNLLLNKEVNLISKDENAVIAKSVNMNELNSSYVGSLKITGNLLTCGTVNDNGLLSFTENKGEIITLTEEEFENYLTSRKVTFDANGGVLGTEADYKMIPFNGLMGELPFVSRDYFTFKGWFTEPEGGEEVTAESVMTSLVDITLYAQWEEHAPSAWVLKSEMPSDAQVVDTKYTYTLTEYTTSSSSSMSGWEKYNETWEWGPWGAWSGWSTTQYYDSDSRDAESTGRSRWVDTSYNLHEYHYYSWMPKKGWYYTTQSAAKAAGVGTPVLNEIWISYQLPKNKYSGGMQHYGPHSDGYLYFKADGTAGGLSPFERDRWISQGYTETWTEWRYRDRSKVWTYYFRRNLSLESSTNPSGENISNVQEWVQYRSK